MEGWDQAPHGCVQVFKAAPPIGHLASHAGQCYTLGIGMWTSCLGDGMGSLSQAPTLLDPTLLVLAFGFHHGSLQPRPLPAPCSPWHQQLLPLSHHLGWLSGRPPHGQSHGRSSPASSVLGRWEPNTCGAGAQQQEQGWDPKRGSQWPPGCRPLRIGKEWRRGARKEHGTWGGDSDGEPLTR